ncbi:hypothetical protein [Azohydromonas australica]|uniref:hypothetical protein n=1 Tax=Azohydromonas australica TaxID=364039 RepID=UPI000414FD5D|nr:hypothetical protein [Azohydromonas australica]
MKTLSFHAARAVACAFVVGSGAGLVQAQQASAANGSPGTASTPVIYPAKGQSARQQDKDRYECHDWSRQQSGYDPSQAASTTTATGAAAGAAPPGAGLAQGALRGAAVGELVSHDAGRGAAIGVLGSAAQAQARQAEQSRQQQAMRDQKRVKYERAFSACMEGRGYVLK